MGKHNKVKEFVIEKSTNMMNKPTVGEQNFINFCERYKIKYHFQKPIKLEGRWFIPDFVFYSNGNKKKNDTTKRKIIVEIDGEYHFTDVQREKDRERTKLLEKNGFSILRFKNHETSNEENIRLKLKCFLKCLKEEWLYNKIVSPMHF